VAGIKNVSLTKKIRLAEIPHDATAENIMKKLPGLYKTFGKQDLYGKNQVNEKPVATLGLACILMSRPEVPEDVVYKITKATFENLDEFSKSHASAKDVQLKTALEGMPLPLHPGAEKYYKEVGLIK
jgi:TRAP transporter TAXI family solute receptor